MLKTLIYSSIACLLLVALMFYATYGLAATDKRKLTPPVIHRIVYKVARAVLSCPNPKCDFEVVTTFVDNKRVCHRCGEFLQATDIRY